MTTPKNYIQEDVPAEVPEAPVAGTHDTLITGGVTQVKDRVVSAMLGIPPLRPETIAALYDAIAEAQKEWKDRRSKSPIVDFLNSISSVDELKAVRYYCESHGLLPGLLKPHNTNKFDHEYDPTCTFDTYQGWLARWEHPEEALPEHFREHFPLVSQKLDTPEKVRILLRFAAFCGYKTDVYLVGKILSEIIQDHEVYGRNIIHFHQPDFYTGADRMPKYQITQKLAYYSQLQPDTLRRVMLPGLRSSGAGGYSCFVSWEEKQKD